MSVDMTNAIRAARRLPPRQKAVLRALADGKFRKEIAHENGIALGTVNQHCNALFLRLGIHSRVEAARVAVAARIV